MATDMAPGQGEATEARHSAPTGPPSHPAPDPARPPMRVALRPYAGPITVLSLILACLLVAALVAVIGARQPSIVLANNDAPTDSFSRPDESNLGRVPGGQRWQTTGSWGIFNGTATLFEKASGKGPTFATTDAGDRDMEVEAKLVGIDGLGGIVFLYKDSRNYGMFFPVPEFGTWQLRMFKDGKQVVDQNIGLESFTDGSIASVVVNGSWVTALVNNQVAGQISIPAGFDGTRAGLGSLPGEATKTRFDDYVVLTKADR